MVADLLLRKIPAALLPTVLLWFACSALLDGQNNRPTPQKTPVDYAGQLVLITTSDWRSTEGVLRRYERASGNEVWRSAGKSIPVVFGRNGLAWGDGLQGKASAFSLQKEPVKHEGDLKEPAGAFHFGAAFADPAHFPLPPTSIQTIETGPALQCVDDPHSPHYNQLVDPKNVSRDWMSSEPMERSDGLYRMGIVVEFNSNPPTAGKGSCIFLHVWAGPHTGTEGCTAMPESDLRYLLTWLNPRRHPVLVQLPLEALQRNRQAGGFRSVDLVGLGFVDAAV